MFGIGSSELVVIILVALLVLGPKRLPEVMKVIGRVLAELRKTADDVKKELGAEAGLKDIQDSLNQISDVPRLVQMQMEKELEELKKVERELGELKETELKKVEESIEELKKVELEAHGEGKTDDGAGKPDGT